MTNAPGLNETQNFTDRFSQTAPLGFFFTQPFLPGTSESVESRTPIVLSGPPFGVDPARLLHAMKGGVQRSLFNAQCVIGDLLNARGDAVPMPRLTTERLQNEKIERPLKRVGLLSLC